MKNIEIEISRLLELCSLLGENFSSEQLDSLINSYYEFKENAKDSFDEENPTFHTMVKIFRYGIALVRMEMSNYCLDEFYSKSWNLIYEDYIEVEYSEKDLVVLPPLSYEQLYTALNLLPSNTVKRVLGSDGINVYNALFSLWSNNSKDKFIEKCGEKSVEKACRVIVADLLHKESFKSELERLFLIHAEKDLENTILVTLSSHPENIHLFEMYQGLKKCESTVPIINSKCDNIKTNPENGLEEIQNLCVDINEKTDEQIILFKKVTEVNYAKCVALINNSSLPLGVQINLKQLWETFEPVFRDVALIPLPVASQDQYFPKLYADIVSEAIDNVLGGEVSGRCVKGSKDFSGEDKLEDKIKYQNNQEEIKNERLPVPLRFKENHIGSQYYESILRKLYSFFKNNFLKMTEDDFVYFFQGTNKKPCTYNPPYYWDGDENEMKALLRILYTSSTGDRDRSRSFGTLILMPKDRNMERPRHNWSRGKHNLGKTRLTQIENQLSKIVQDVCGKVIMPINLNRKYVNGVKKKSNPKKI